MKKMRAVATLLLMVLLVLPLSGCGEQTEGETNTQTEEEIMVQTVKTSSFEMDYLQFGQGEKTLVILPGLSVQSVMSSAAEICDAYAPLTKDFTILLFEPRKELPGTYFIADMAKDTASAIRTLGIEEYAVLGVSQGGMIALELAALEPNRVQKLALASMVGKMTEHAYAVIDHWVELAKEQKAEELYLAFGEAVYPSEVFEQSREILVDAAKTVTEEELRRFVQLAQTMEGYDGTSSCKKIRCPMFVAVDKTDGVFGLEEIEGFLEFIRANTTGYVKGKDYEGFGHALYDLAPDFKEKLLAFLLEEETE